MIDLKKEPLLSNQTCNMCSNTSFKKRKMYEWVGTLTKTELIICEPCAKRETGSKSWKKYKKKFN